MPSSNPTGTRVLKSPSTYDHHIKDTAASQALPLSSKNHNGAWAFLLDDRLKATDSSAAVVVSPFRFRGCCWTVLSFFPFSLLSLFFLRLSRCGFDFFTL